ncbi:MAG: hypothetical protein D4S01_08645 [Dehalococcoidia bacterium]|nr:MAG: hypothetical protein D4S01_08645 [Dehalococcoidia bacterium]
MLPRSPSAKEFQKCLISWYKKEGRNFYWRTQALSPWQWLVLELLLKRTRAETVEKFFPSFIAKYHRPEVVVEASDQELEEDLKFLGLQRQRRVALKRIAEKITRAYNGKVPVDYDSLLSLPYVGRYIANAVLCFSQNQRRSIVDINVARVLTRFHGLEMPKDAREEWIWELAKKTLPEKNWKEYNYALLDLGAKICKSKEPRCSQCWVQSICIKGNRNLTGGRQEQ